ncbi:putative disease resistance protein RGA1, partial [Bienertia sinuspersici]
MADFGISIAEKLLETMGSELIKQVCDMWGYKSQLNDLKETVSTIKKVLLDADARRELSDTERDYIGKLKDAVYDADDLFDEFLTLAELKQLRPLNKRGKFFEKVRCFFSSKNQLGQAYKMSRDVKHIKKRLDDIADTHKKFGFNVDYKPIVSRREETCSYVDANEIIGRDKDKEAIIELLLDHNNEEICCTAIVGVGGLGKTALAQLVYHDERINKEFCENMKLWVCVSDQEGEQFDVKTIFCKILEIVTHQKCFFQDVVKSKYDHVDSVKIHDLMHDVAQEVGREEICVVTCISNTLRDKIRHVCYAGDSCLETTLGSSKLRSFICQGYGTCVLDVHTQIQNQMCLRVLELSSLNVVKLPNSIGKLQHLRYLDLSYNFKLELLPNAITRLHNLQSLILGRCMNLRELPKDFCKLVKLRHLDLLGCNELICMPFGMEKLTSLEVLPYFVVGKRASKDVEFETLRSFTNIRGNIRIRIGENYRKVEGMNENNKRYLKSLKHLTWVYVHFDGRCDDPEGVLETLEPPSNVKELTIYNYKGTRIPKWGNIVDNWAFSLSRLVEITLSSCKNLEEMPVVSKLPLLKRLSLESLDKLEYMEEITSNESDTQSVELFFPSLVNLEINGLIKLKGWRKDESSSSPPLNWVDDDHCCCLNRRLRFPCLSKLSIFNCPCLTSFPCCPAIEQLKLENANKRLQIYVDIDDDTPRNSQVDFRLWKLEIDNIDYLKSLPLNCLTYLLLYSDEEVDNRLSKSGEVEGDILEKLASSLKTLLIDRMNNVKRLCGETGLQHFTTLEKLTLGHGLLLTNEDGEDEFEACCFPQNLRSLDFISIPKMTSLPKVMQYLTSLQHLCLFMCVNLKALPEWISCLSSLKCLEIAICPALRSLPQAMPQLTSLQSLSIFSCPELQERCKEPNGEDRPKIQHIPHI